MVNAIAYPHVIKEDAKPARLEGHPRVRVAQIVMDYLAYGWSADEIHRQHPHLALAEVHAAMGSYYDNQADWATIDAEIAAELEEVDRVLDAEARSPVWLKLKAQRTWSAGINRVRYQIVGAAGIEFDDQVARRLGVARVGADTAATIAAASPPAAAHLHQDVHETSSSQMKKGTVRSTSVTTRLSCPGFAWRLGC